MESAVAAYERSVDIGLPSRFFWYRFDFFTALNAMGEHEPVLELTEPLVAEVDSLAELHVERGHAFAAMGQEEDAVAAYQQAVRYLAHPEDVQAVLDKLLRSVTSAQPTSFTDSIQPGAMV